MVEGAGPVAHAVAFGGGVVSFLSPCVLPLVPGYLSVITGLDVAELDGRRQGVGLRRSLTVVRDTGLFIGGFGAVFVGLGLSATTVGRALFDHQLLLTRISGVVVMVMALLLVASVWLRAPWLYREARFHPRLGRWGRLAPPVAGAAFGFGWTPCIGPVLASILAVAAQSGRALDGATLLGAYSLGLGVPFLVTGLALDRLSGALGFVKHHGEALVVVSGLVLAGFGALLITNRLLWVTSQIQEALRAVGLERLVFLG